MLLLENMKLAFLAIKVNKMRSFLTMLGIIIGISSVISIVSIGDTMRGAVGKLYEDIGANQVILWTTGLDYYTDEHLFTFDELDTIIETFPEDIEYIGARVGAQTEAVNGRKKVKTAINGVREGFEVPGKVDIIYGRMVNKNDRIGSKMNIVIESQMAIDLFGKENAVGKTFSAVINGETEEVNVIGVHKKKESLLSAMMMSSTPQSYMPESAIVGSYARFWDVQVFVKNIDDQIFKTRLIGLAARMKNLEPENIYYASAADEMGTMDTVLMGMSAAVGAIAAISLLVGGIGIMNIMLVSVTERTREIGIRKALGARTKDILVQFLIESAIISAAGGIIGTAIGIGFVMIGGVLLKMPVVVNPMIIVIAVAFSAVVGVFFGIYPARKAAMADPIDALRYE